MADKKAAQQTTPELWLMTRSFPTRRAMIESDHLLLLSSNGYRDTMRRILFNQIERIYVTEARPLSGRVGVGLLLFVIDAAICTLFLVNLPTLRVKFEVLAFVGWPLPLLIAWMIFVFRNPTHRLFIIRASRRHEINTTLSRAKFTRFYSELCLRIRQYQSQSLVFNIPPTGAGEGTPASSGPDGPTDVTSPPASP